MRPNPALHRTPLPPGLAGVQAAAQAVSPVRCVIRPLDEAFLVAEHSKRMYKKRSHAIGRRGGRGPPTLFSPPTLPCPDTRLSIQSLGRAIDGIVFASRRGLRDGRLDTQQGLMLS